MLRNVKMSLADMLGNEYIEAVKTCTEALMGQNKDEVDRLGNEKIDFLDVQLMEKADQLLEKVGTSFVKPFANDNTGASTESFEKAAKNCAAPIGGYGCFRVGEDGKLYLISKSEHYQSSLGHNFGGYKLINNARRLGILNATHNNTRGYIVRLLERELIRTINGLGKTQVGELEDVLVSDKPKVLNKVLNLETGSLACEAAIKMMLARFYKLDSTFADRKYEGKTPVFFIMGDTQGGIQANYHGTTIFPQTMRGLWPDIRTACEEKGLYKVVPVKINDIKDFKEKIKKYNEDNYKTAGFIHEIILMNYGGIKLTKEFLKSAYDLCKKYDTPTMADEIQSCMWYSGMYLFRHYELEPDFVILGKGFPGGEYPASKVITTAEMDSLNQFGALVTNGQEELSSLAYLITMEFVQANGKEIDDLGMYTEHLFQELAAKYPNIIDKVEGKGHLIAIHFNNVDDAVELVKNLNEQCIDISAQTYKANCPPAALLKLPLVASEKTLNMLHKKAEQAIASM